MHKWTTVWTNWSSKVHNSDDRNLTKAAKESKDWHTLIVGLQTYNFYESRDIAPFAMLGGWIVQGHPGSLWRQMTLAEYKTSDLETFRLNFLPGVTGTVYSVLVSRTIPKKINLNKKIAIAVVRPMHWPEQPILPTPPPDFFHT